jgi:uncharacterized cupin superfamily protein
VLSGTVLLKGRIDYSSGPVTGGIFQSQCTDQFKVRITMPFTEHGTVIHGVFVLTDESGQQHIFKPGDSYLIQQGSVVVWEQNDPLLQKSFFNVVQ